VLRAALQPLQWIRFSAQQRGELAQLRGAEALDAAPRLVGQAMLAGFYLSELTLRLAPRQDPLPELYLAYGEARALAVGAGLAWTLRRFERELLSALGLGFELDSASDGQPIDPAARYELDPQEGAQRLLSERGGSAGRRPLARRCWRLRPTKSPMPPIWPACACRCGGCWPITWAARPEVLGNARAAAPAGRGSAGLAALHLPNQRQRQKLAIRG
jgi:hypothetical protein